MFEIEMLPAREGDCLWIRYGDPSKPQQILIDGGRTATAKELKKRLAKLPAGEKIFELLIISHVDRDHIEGVLELLGDKTLDLKFKDIWFNGYDHLLNVPLETFGAVQGELLSATLIERSLPWNRKFKGKAVCVTSKGLKRIKLDGGMAITLLSPDRGKLLKLEPKWKRECELAGLMPGKAARRSEVKGLESFGGIDIEQLSKSEFQIDNAEPNGSSIAVVVEFEKKSALLAADAHPDRLIDSIKILKKSDKRLKLDAFKVAHHGSEHNISTELLRLVDCKRYLISTNGSYFHHPRAEAIARIVKFGGKKPTLFFNYRTDFTEVWDSQPFRDHYKYNVVYPEKKNNGWLTVSL